MRRESALIAPILQLHLLVFTKQPRQSQSNGMASRQLIENTWHSFAGTLLAGQEAGNNSNDPQA
jgi:hypothetical protein